MSQQALQQLVWDNREGLPQVVIYDVVVAGKPAYLAMLWTALPEPKQTGFRWSCPDIEPLQSICEGAGLVKLMPNEGDDPAIVEVWV